MAQLTINTPVDNQYSLWSTAIGGFYAGSSGTSSSTYTQVGTDAHYGANQIVIGLGGHDIAYDTIGGGQIVALSGTATNFDVKPFGFGTDPWVSITGISTNLAEDEIPFDSIKVMTAHYLTGNDAINGNTSADFLSGYAGNDTIFGYDSTDALYGNQGNDVIYGNTGNDTLFGGQGGDLINAGQDNDLVYGNNQNDVIYGNFGDDHIFAGRDEDVVYGGQGNDIIAGNLGNDTLLGNQGDDTLYGNTGLDSLSGGAGNDVFVFEEGVNGSDFILDLDINHDKISIFGADAAALVANAVNDGSGNTIIQYQDGLGAIYLMGISPSQVTASLFI